MNLNDIHSPADIKGLRVGQLADLCTELRTALLEKLSRHGGHIGPNLGMVEMTVALHYVFDSPEDKIVFDVSHQSYVHKMLTGRMDAFTNPDDYDKVSGFTSPKESEHDFFTIGHTSTATSLATGLAKARNMRGSAENIIAVVGDGSLSGGEALEGLDYGATLDSNFIVVINDNDMSIAPNHGGIYDNLRLLRETDGQAECNLFKAMGYDYRYVAYGNDVAALVDTFTAVRGSKHPVVVHVNTQKGKGYAPAEAHREEFHFGAPFDKATGEPLKVSEAPDYTSIFASHALGMLAKYPDMVILTAGTAGAFGFGPKQRKIAGDRFVDVGIAEQDAVGMAAGLAKGGMRPVFAVVSSFLQRAYDQLSQDVAIDGNPAVLNIVHNGVYAMNDATHLGWFDIALVANIPNWVFLAPTCKEEYLAMLDWAVQQREHPVAVRQPGGRVVESGREYEADFSKLNTFEMVRRGNKVALIGAGTFFSIAAAAADKLAEKGIDATLINPRFLSGLDKEMLTGLLDDHSVVITLEDGCIEGGFGQKVATFYGPTDMHVRCYGLPKEFHDRFSATDLLALCGITPDAITADILSLLK